MTSAARALIPRWKLAVLLFVQASASGMHTAPLTNIMEAHGLPWAPAFIFTACSLAAMVSPLLIGALADLKFSPERMLSMNLMLSAAATLCVYLAVDFHWPRAAFIASVCAFALCVAPLWGLLTAICLAGLTNPKSEFPPLRVTATIGWMAALLFLSFVLRADNSPRAGYTAAGLFAAEAVFCAFLPRTHRPRSMERRPLRDMFGWQAIALLKHPDHRLIFITTALFSIPLAAFYPYTGPHLRDLGASHPAAVLSLAQISEIFAMVTLPWFLRRFRMKWVLATGLILGVARYALYAGDTFPFVVSGLLLHGVIYTFFFITGQLYLEERAPRSLRAQGQALMSLMATGVGSLIGYAAGGWWYAWCREDGTMRWTLFWSVQTLVTALITLAFLIGYRGRKQEPASSPVDPIPEQPPAA